jgi:hypothetical protein
MGGEFCPTQQSLLAPEDAQCKLRSRFDSTKPTELRFSALLTEDDARMRFHRDEGFDQLKEDIA